MDAKQLASMVCDCLSGPNRVQNTNRLSRLVRGRWSKFDAMWQAVFGVRAPLVCSFNLSGMTAEKDHHPLAEKLSEWACS